MCKTGSGAGKCAGAKSNTVRKRSNHARTEDQAGRQKRANTDAAGGWRVHTADGTPRRNAPTRSKHLSFMCQGDIRPRAAAGSSRNGTTQAVAATTDCMHWHALACTVGGATDGAIVPARLWPLSWWVRTQKHHEAIVPARLWPFSLCPGGSGHKNITRPLPQDKATPFFRSSLTAPTWMHGFPWADLLHPCHAMPLCNIVWPHEAVNVKLL